MTTWTEDQRQAVRDGYAAKDTAAVIGKRLGKTRNSVIGQANRLGLQVSSRNPAKAKPLAEVLSRKPRPKIDPIDPDRAMARPSTGSTKECQWIFSHPGDPDWPNICGRESVFGYPYCMAHCLKAYRGMKGLDYTPEHFLRRAEALKRSRP